MSTTYRDFGFDYPPFADTVDPQFLFPSSGVRQAWNCLDGYMQSGRDVIFLLGGPGIGKTLLYRDLLENQWRHIPFALITNPHLQPGEMLATVCDDLGIKYSLENPEETVLWEKLREYMVEAGGERGKKVLLIVDDAQDLTEGSLDVLYRLHQLGREAGDLLRILLVGQPETVEVFKGTLIPQTGGDRSAAKCHLGPLSKTETIAYIHYRLKIAGGSPRLFTKGAVRTAYRVAEGIPRVLNILCDHALHEAQAQSRKKITASLVRLSASKYLKGEPAVSSWDFLPEIPLESITSKLSAVGRWFRRRGKERVLPPLPSPSSVADDHAGGSSAVSQDPGGHAKPSDEVDDDLFDFDTKKTLRQWFRSRRVRVSSLIDIDDQSMDMDEMVHENSSHSEEAASDALSALESATEVMEVKKAAASVGPTVVVPKTTEGITNQQASEKDEAPSAAARVGASWSPKILKRRPGSGSGKKKPAPAPPPGMVYVDAMELRSAYSGRPISAGGFFLDRTPVTCADYSRFIEATGHPPPHDWLGNKPLPSLLHCPVVNVSLQDARSYADWCGKRLPTFIEWECAARRPDNRRFPWGDQWEPHRCNSPEMGLGRLTEVDAYPEGSSVDGCLDLVGNTWEWTEMPEDDEAGVDLPDPGYHWVMGGSFRHPCHAGDAIARTALLMTQRYRFLGFRCAQEVI